MSRKFKRFISWLIPVVAILLLCGTAWMVFMRPNSNQTHVTLDVDAPVITHFSDDSSAIFLTASGIPDINNNRNLSGVAPLDVYYTWQSGEYTDTFRANLTDADIAANVKITPFIRGKWQMFGPNMLRFIPESDWPADTKFSVRINDELFNNDIATDTRTATIRTPEFTAKLDSFNTYPDTTNPQNVTAVAIVSFNYPIDTNGFVDRVSMKQDNSELKFSVKFDRFNRTAFIVSDPIKITGEPHTIRFKLNRVSVAGADAKTQKLTARTTVESSDNFFKISGVTTTVADDATGNAQQLLLINTTAAAAKKTNWNEFIDLYLLPTYIDETQDDDTPHEWANDEITPDVLTKSQKLDFKPLDFVSPAGVYQYAFGYDVSSDNNKYIYVSIKSGIESVGGFRLKDGLAKVMPVPYPTASVEIAGHGALLSLAGDKKLGIVARGGVHTAYMNLYKVKSSEINHMISQTYGLFSNNIDFKSWSFNAYDMSVIFQKALPFADTSVRNTNYASVDLGEYLDRTGADKTGIFMVQAADNKEDADFGDRRLILLTNMGIVHKVNQDTSSAVFVATLSTGEPATDVEISVLGRNGNPIWAGRTDDAGHADIPRFAPSEYKDAKQPVAIVARNGNDVSFIPYNDMGMRTEYSKFDIDGAYASNTAPLNAFVFSDRGIYRPGETAIIAGIVKNKSFKSVTGIPVKLDIRDPRGRQVIEQMFSLGDNGMFETQYAILSSATTGEYTANVYSLNTKNKPQDILGTTTFRVAEFTPDTLKINATIVGATDNGWISTNDMTANVYLQNMFGTVAANRRITAQITLQPIAFTFPEYKGYTFTPNFISGNGVSNGAATRAQTFTTNVTVQTDDTGTATITPDFDTVIPSGTYALGMNIRGFDSGDNDGVQTTIVTRASDAKYLIGWHANTDLGYINRNADQTINIIAIDNTAKKIGTDNLTLRLIQRENLTSLIKDADDYYKYQTVTRDKVVSQNKLSISENGTDIKLDTTNSGTFYLQILNADEQILANIEYDVVSDENDALSADTMADMQIKLDKDTFAPGDTIHINITAPYTGAGLITIERDKVYAYEWFKTSKNASVQTIKVPEKFEGTGYVNVSFVRDINSRDIFTTPYAYAVAPFATDVSKRRIDVDLTAPEKTDSNQLTIEYKTGADAQIMIFAVNTGILQVAKYALPRPLAYFFKKSALQVDTFQTLSLLLPEYKILREFAKTGGGDFVDPNIEANQMLTNPFARRTDKAVAFYSGVIDAKKDVTGTVTFDVPESFNGSITTFAVAANTGAVGSANTTTQIQSPIIISAQIPTAVAPGDKFDVNATISNLTQTPNIKVSANVSGALTIKGKSAMDLDIPQNTDKTITLSLNAIDNPGNSELKIFARSPRTNDTPAAERTAFATTSVRPVTTFTTRMRTGDISSKSVTVRDFADDMYAKFNTLKLYISANSDAAIKPLFNYLSHYEYDCSEQIVSRTLPYALMPENKFLGITHDAAAKEIATTVNILKNRQNDDGSFDLWSGAARGRDNESDTNTAYVTAYITEFLTIAKENGFNIPREMLSRATGYLRTFAGGNITDERDAAATAYAIYVITQNGFVPTSYIDTFEEYASKNIKNWKSDLMGVYIAAAYKMLKKNDVASDLVSQYKSSNNSGFVFDSMFDNNVANDAVYTYIMTHYFDMAAGTIPNSIREYINSGNYSAYTSAMAIMGLAGQSDATVSADAISVTSNNGGVNGSVTDGTFVADIPVDATRLEIKCETCADKSLLYTILQQGFPRESKPQSNGIEVIREYYDENNRRITSANVGDTVTVKIFARAAGTANYVPNAVISDLLPGGFVPDTESLTGDTEFSDFREDRVIIYTDISRTTRTITYTAQVTTPGKFAIPPIHAESMYNPAVNATGAGGTFTVSNAVSK